MMEIKDIENTLNEICEETNFTINIIGFSNNLIDLVIDLDNAKQEDVVFTTTIKYPIAKKDLLKIIYYEIIDLDNDFDINKEIYQRIKVAEKSNDIPDVMSIVNLVVAMEEDIYKFIQKINKLLYNKWKINFNVKIRVKKYPKLGKIILRKTEREWLKC